jgi:hypothetical protein
MKSLTLGALLGLGLLAFGDKPPARPQPPKPGWRAVLADRLASYGHRNWVVVADSAYPSQTRAGIETVVTNADQLEVLRAVFEELSRARHVAPVLP